MSKEAMSSSHEEYRVEVCSPKLRPSLVVLFAKGTTNSVEMFRSTRMFYLAGRITQLGVINSQAPKLCFSTFLRDEGQQVKEETSHGEGHDSGKPSERPIGWNITRKEKVNFLTKTLLNLGDSKEAVYGTLDSWVAWEENFPIGALKNVLLALEREQQWHRVVQVIKWLLSKGQGNTMGTYRQLIRALDMDHRAEEAHQFWVKRIGHDLHPVPWQLCSLMISIYYRNDMLDNLVKLFKRLEAHGRKPPEKSIVQKVVNAYQILGLVEEKERVLEKYNDILSQTRKEADKKKKPKKSGSCKTKSSGAN